MINGTYYFCNLVYIGSSVYYQDRSNRF